MTCSTQRQARGRRFASGWQKTGEIGKGIPRQFHREPHAALKVGCSREERIEALMMSAVHGGFPAALNAFAAVSSVLREAAGETAVDAQ